MLDRISRVSAVSLALLCIVLAPARTVAAGVFTNFNGSWSGSGKMRLEGGRSETLRCRANYVERGGGNAVGISLRCASQANRVELRANLTSNSGRVNGDWEEREFNASGSASGTATGNHISLAINGGGLTGSLSLTTSGTRQTVSISTENVALRGIQIALARD